MNTTDHSGAQKAQNAAAWKVYGQRQLDRAYMPPVPQRLNWAWEGVGPGAEVLGDLVGRRILDIGSGPGQHAVHLARTHGALVTAVEQSPTQHQRAVAAHGDAVGVDFALGDVVDHLHLVQAPTSFDAAYSIGSMAFVDPHRLLPALRHTLRTGAPLVFSVLHTDLDGHGPTSTVAPREQLVQLRDTPPLPVQMWVLTPQLWEDLLTENRFVVEHVGLLPSPDPAVRVVHQLLQARR